MVDDRMKRYRNICSACYPKDASQWDSPVKQLVGSKLEDLVHLYKTCRNDVSWEPYPTVHPLDKVVFLATDASLEKGIAGLGAVWSYDYKSSNNNDGFEYRAWRIDHNNNNNKTKSQIALEELRAVLLALRIIINEQNPPNVIMLAIDSIHARSMIDRGVAHSAVGREMLKEMYQLLDGRRLFMVYVESKMNPSDNPSRGHEVHKKCWKETVTRLEKLKQSAVVRLAEKGSTTLKNNVPLFSKLGL